MSEIDKDSSTDSKEIFSIERIKHVGHGSMTNHHFHNYYEIYYLLSGKKHYFLKDRTYHLNQGDMIFIPPNELHKTIDAGAQEVERVLINFSGDFLATQDVVLTRAVNALLFEENRIIRFSPQEQNFIESHLYKMLQEEKNKPTGYRLYSKALLTLLILYAYRHVESHSQEAFNHLSSVHKKVSEITQYVNEHFSEPLMLADVARQFFISPFYLCRIFKETTGFSFNEYLTNIRLKEAQRLLRETNLKVIKVAESCGFGSISHFGRVFKEATGSSPLRFRKTL